MVHCCHILIDTEKKQVPVDDRIEGVIEDKLLQGAMGNGKYTGIPVYFCTVKD